MPTKRKKPASTKDEDVLATPRNKAARTAAAAAAASTNASAAAAVGPPSHRNHPPIPPPALRPPLNPPPPRRTSATTNIISDQSRSPLPPAPPSKPPAKQRNASSKTILKSQSSKAPTSSLPLPPPKIGMTPRQYRNNNSSHQKNNNIDNHHNQNNDASSETTPRTTNAIDEVINEVNHLLQSAAEAQALGRLRNSYSSLLLAHQRLVGVGRRVDRSYCEVEEGDDGRHASNTSSSSNAAEEEGGGDAITAEGGAGEESNLSLDSTHSQSSQQSSSSSPVTTVQFHPPLVSQPPLPPALTQNYTDVAYVEHLARSAMELHHKRTGRGMQHDAALERAAHVAKVKRLEEEQIRIAAQGVFALAGGGNGRGGGGKKAKQPKEEAANTAAAAAAAEGGNNSRSGGLALLNLAKGLPGGTSSAAVGAAPSAVISGDGLVGARGDDNITPTKRKGGRGKKPPTLVMHTMAGRNLDVRELMRGIL